MKPADVDDADHTETKDWEMEKEKNELELYENEKTIVQGAIRRVAGFLVGYRFA